MKEYITIIITSSCSGSIQRTDKEDKNNKNNKNKTNKKTRQGFEYQNHHALKSYQAGVQPRITDKRSLNKFERGA